MPLITAAVGIAPAPSETTLPFSARASIAIAIASSETETTSSRYSLHTANVLSPGALTAQPSAIVLAVAVVPRTPLRMELTIAEASSA